MTRKVHRFLYQCPLCGYEQTFAIEDGLGRTLLPGDAAYIQALSYGWRILKGEVVCRNHEGEAV